MYLNRSKLARRRLRLVFGAQRTASCGRRINLLIEAKASASKTLAPGKYRQFGFGAPPRHASRAK